MLALYMLSSCVCPSVTSLSSTKMAKPRITQTTPYDSPGTLRLKFRRDYSNGSPNRDGVIGNFRPISRFISETVRDILTVES